MKCLEKDRTRRVRIGQHAGARCGALSCRRTSGSLSAIGHVSNAALCPEAQRVARRGDRIHSAADRRFGRQHDGGHASKSSGTSRHTTRPSRCKSSAIGRRLALTQQVAQRLDGDLRRLAMAGQVLTATLAQRTDWKETDLENWMRTVLGQDERIFGMALAFEPRQFDPDLRGLLHLSVSWAQRDRKEISSAAKLLAALPRMGVVQKASAGKSRTVE